MVQHFNDSTTSCFRHHGGSRRRHLPSLSILWPWFNTVICMSTQNRRNSVFRLRLQPDCRIFAQPFNVIVAFIFYPVAVIVIYSLWPPVFWPSSYKLLKTTHIRQQLKENWWESNQRVYVEAEWNSPDVWSVIFQCTDHITNWLVTFFSSTLWLIVTVCFYTAVTFTISHTTRLEVNCDCLTVITTAEKIILFSTGIVRMLISVIMMEESHFNTNKWLLHTYSRNTDKQTMNLC